MAKRTLKVAVIVPNWNGADHLADCLDSLLLQTLKAHVIVVENGSTDGSLELLEKYPDVEVIKHTVNKGFAGGVNAGFCKAIANGYEFVATLNNDAVADKHWLKELLVVLESDKQVGIVTSKILNADGSHIDSTGDYYTAWGLPYPRGRGETELNKYDEQLEIFGASGGASMYRAQMLEKIGMFDEDFFAYYEDVDLSFRARLAGWEIRYVPAAVVYHQISATSNKLRGFATYQTMKNLQLLYYKNVPARFRYKIGWRFTLASTLFYLRAISRGMFWPATKGDLRGTYLMFKKRSERKQIQQSQTISDKEVWDLLVHGLPPNARALRRLRSRSRKLRGKA